MNIDRRESGFTVIELLVVMLLFSVIVIGFYSVMFAGQRGATTTRDVADVSQEARLGFNRMVRDTREAALFSAATATSYSVEVDFDGDGTSLDPFEKVTYAYDAVNDRITIEETGAPASRETLIDGVEPIPGKDVFSYSSNLLEYDTLPASPPPGGDGITTFAELDAARNAGASLPGSNLLYISHVTFAFVVESGDSSQTFYTQAQVRNARSVTT